MKNDIIRPEIIWQGHGSWPLDMHTSSAIRMQLKVHMCDYLKLCLRLQSHSLDSLIELQLPPSNSSSDPAKTGPIHPPLRRRLRSLLLALSKALHLSSSSHVSTVGHRPDEVFGFGSGSSGQLVRASTIDSAQIRICQREGGEAWRLGMGSFGVVGPLPPNAFLSCMHAKSLNQGWQGGHRARRGAHPVSRDGART